MMQGTYKPKDATVKGLWIGEQHFYERSDSTSLCYAISILKQATTRRGWRSLTYITRGSDDTTTEMNGRRCKELQNLDINSGTALLRTLWFHLTLLRYLSTLKAGDEAKWARLIQQEVAMIDTTTQTTGRRCKELRNLRTPLWDRLNSRRAWLSLRKLWLHLHSVMESEHRKKQRG